MLRQLENVNSEFEIDEAAGAKLHVERPARGLMPFDLRAHPGSVARHGLEIARETEDAVDYRADVLSNGRRAEHGPGAAERHVLPGPRLLSLVSLEGIERDDQHAFRPFRPKPR